jgi:hypothetical protein
MTPWRGAITGNEMDDTVEKMAHVALTSLCECSLATTSDTPIALFQIHNQDESKWQQHLEVVCDLTSPHNSPSPTQMAKYVRYLFNLQHNTGRVITE